MTCRAPRLRPLPLFEAVGLVLLAATLIAPRPLWSQGVGASFTALLTADLAAATTVFQGVVMNSQPAKNATTSIITSSVVIQRSVVLKGTLAATTKTISIPGGTVGDRTFHVSSTPQVTVGDRVIVLLDADGNPRPGQFLYRLDPSGTVDDTPGLTLNDVRGLI